MGTLNIEITGNAAEILRELQAFPQEMRKAIAGALDVENQMTMRHIGQNKLSRRGPTTLGRVTSTLLQSLRATPVQVGSTSVETAIGTNVEYAGVHERGAVIRAKNKPYLRFNVGGRWVQKKSVTLPARRWLSSGIEERADNYSRALGEAIERAWT
jgi:phage gpG-like protein